MAYWDDEDDDTAASDEMVSLADDSLDTDKFGEQAVRQQEAQGQQLEQEFDALPATGAPAKPAATKQISGAKEKYSGIMDEYKSLQEKRGKDVRNLAIVDGLSQIGQAFAARHSPNYKVKSNMDMFEKWADRPVQDYSDNVKQKGLDLELKDQQMARDPNSPLAQRARSMLTERGYKVDPAMSSKDATELMKFGDPLKEQGQRQQLEIGAQSLTQGGQKIQSGATSLKDSEQMHDANSNISEFYRSMAVKRGFTPEEVAGKSAFDIQAMGKMMPKPASSSKQFQTKQIYNPSTKQIETIVFDTSTGQTVSGGPLGTAGFAQKPVENKRTGEYENYNPALGSTTGKLTSPTPQSAEQTQARVPEITKEQLPVSKQKQLDEYRKEFLADTKDDRTALQASRSIKGLLASGKALDGDILRAVQNKFARATGERGAMTEQDVAPYGGKQAVTDRIGRQMSMWTTGKIPDEDRKFLSGLADLMQKQTERDLSQRTEFFSNNLYNDLKADPEVKASSFTPESVKKLLGSDIYDEPMVKVKNKKTGQTGSMPAQNVEAAVKSGQFEVVK